MFRTKLIPFMMVMMFVLSSFSIMSDVVSAAPATIYSDGFESGLAKWDNASYAHIYPSTTQHHNGTHSLKMVSAGGIYYENHTLASSTSYPFQGEVWFYVDDLTSGSRFQVYGVIDSVSSQASPNFYVRNDSGTIILEQGVQFGSWTYTEICELTMDAWHHIYFNATLFSSFKLWVDDVPYGFIYITSFGVNAKKLTCAKTVGTGTVYVDDWLLGTNQVDPSGWPPTITSTPTTTIHNGQTYYYNITVNESCTYVVNDHPAWANITDPTHIHGIPTASGHYAFNISATSVAGTGVKKQGWDVYSTPIVPWSPTITSTPASLYAHIDQVYYYNITTNETSTYFLYQGPNAGHVDEVTGKYVMNLSAYWCAYYGVPTGIVTGPYITFVRVTSANGTAYTDHYFNLTITPNEWMPTYISSPSWSGKVGTTYYYNVSMSETCTYQVITSPAWANITDPTHIHGVPTLYGSFDFKLRATSVNGTLGRNQSWTVTVVNSTTWAPTITSTPITKIILGATYYYNLTANESILALWLNYVTGPGYFLFSNYDKNYAWTPIAPGKYHFSVRATSVNGSLYTVQSWDLLVLGHGWFTTVTNSPALTGNANHTYYYNITTNESCQITNTGVIGPAWADLTDPFHIHGTPTIQGYYSFSLRYQSVNGRLYAYLNWTVHILIQTPWAPSFTSTPSTLILHTPTAIWNYNITLNESCTILYYVAPSWILGEGVHPDGHIPNTYFNISGHPVIGKWPFIIKATSVNGMLSVYQCFNVTALGTGWAPTITNSPSQIAYCNLTYYYNLTANESCTVTWTTSPSWINVLDPFHIYGEPYYVANYWLNFSARSTNGLLWANQTWQVGSHQQVLWSPTITSTPTTSVNMGSIYTYDVNANESCTYQFLSSLNAASINTTTGLITINLSPYWVQYWGVYPGTYPFIVQATSVAGYGSVTQSWYLTVVGHNWLPAFTCTAITSIGAGESYSLLITVNESCTISSLNLPTWLTMSNNNSNSLYEHWLVGTAPNVNGTSYVRIRATSVLGDNDAYLTFNVQVIHTVPITPASGFMGMILLVAGMMTLLCPAIAVTYWKYGDDTRKAVLWIIAFLVFAVMFFGLIGAI